MDKSRKHEAQEALKRLLSGNKNFVEGTPKRHNMTLSTLQKFAKHQNPYAAVLTCSDSRVVPEIIFDCGIGEIFVVRVAGMTAGPNIIESIEYAVKSLKVPLLILMGHDDCGVMKYAQKTYPAQPDNFKSIMSCVYPVLDREQDVTCERFTKQHTLWVQEVFKEKSEIIKNAIDNNELYVAICHFDHSTGEVSLLD